MQFSLDGVVSGIGVMLWTPSVWFTLDHIVLLFWLRLPPSLVKTSLNKSNHAIRWIMICQMNYTIHFFTITTEIFELDERIDSLIYDLCNVLTSESGQFDIEKKPIDASFYWQWISPLHCQSSQQIHSPIASWIHSYFDYVMTKFMINNRTDAWKTDVNLLMFSLLMNNGPFLLFVSVWHDHGNWVQSPPEEMKKTNGIRFYRPASEKAWCVRTGY